MSSGACQAALPQGGEERIKCCRLFPTLRGPRLISGRSWPHLNASFRHPGFAVACSQASLRFGPLCGRPTAPSRPLVQVGDGQLARQHRAGMPIADPSPDGGSLRSRRASFRLISAPRILWVGRNGRFVLSGCREYVAFRVFPPPPPVGERGKKERRVSRGLRIAPDGRSKVATGTEIGTRLVSSKVPRSESRYCHAKNCESST
jgi:hypothetical protein